MLIPDGHFLNNDGPIPLIVRDEDGIPTHAVVAGELIPHDDFKADLAHYFELAGEVLPPPKDFAVVVSANAPTADEMFEAIRAEGIDLAALVAPLGEGYFVHVAPGQAPLVVEHATGEPKYRVVDGSLVSLA